jgi:hypothetical protein
VRPYPRETSAAVKASLAQALCDILAGMPPTVPPHADKRQILRARTFRSARCVFNAGGSTLDVTLRDISPTGARISGDGLIVLPPTFEVQILDGFGGYSSRRARLVWARGAGAGLEFID